MSSGRKEIQITLFNWVLFDLCVHVRLYLYIPLNIFLHQLIRCILNFKLLINPKVLFCFENVVERIVLTWFEQIFIKNLYYDLFLFFILQKISVFEVISRSANKLDHPWRSTHINVYLLICSLVKYSYFIYMMWKK